MKKTISIIIGIIMMCSVCAINASASVNEIFVSVSGSDTNAGTKSSPLATLSAAKEMAKTMDGDVTVYFREGKYTMTDTVNFTADDKDSVTYKAYNGEKVVFTAGVPYTGFEEATANGVRAFRKYVGKDADFNVLFNETTTLSRTRYPESGYLTVESVSDSDTVWASEIQANYYTHVNGFTAKSGEMKQFYNTQDVVIRVLHYWKDEISTLTAYDASTRHVTFSHPSSMTVSEGDRYFLENVFEELKEPGQWYLDKTGGVLWYIPYEGETAADLTLWGSETETLISISGVDNISFENIIFRGNGFVLPDENSEIDFSQAAYDAPQCLKCEDSDGFTVKNCEFRDIAGGCVFLGSAVTGATVDSCIFENIGAQAVYIRGENIPVDDPRVTKNITVTNNKINGYGRNFFNAVGILVIHANSVDVTHNEISDGYYTAISCGWVWGYAYNVTNNCHISDNLIYNIGQGWLSDMGGIYMLGNQPGTVISGNVIHNVAADPGQGGYGGWGIYLDEGSGYMTVENNLVYNCGSNCYHLHYGIDNLIQNNIFAFGGDSCAKLVSRTEGHLTATFSHNIFLTAGGTPVTNILDEKGLVASDGTNIIANATDENAIYFLDTDGNGRAAGLYEMALKGVDFTKDTFTDPGFEDALNYDFTLTDDSAAVKNGFIPWDYSVAGTLDGTTVGATAETGFTGGSTAYNGNVSEQTLNEPSHFFTAFTDFFCRIFYTISKIFSC